MVRVFREFEVGLRHRRIARWWWGRGTSSSSHSSGRILAIFAYRLAMQLQDRGESKFFFEFYIDGSMSKGL